MTKLLEIFRLFTTQNVPFLEAILNAMSITGPTQCARRDLNKKS
jgi:hypothetical protein